MSQQTRVLRRDQHAKNADELSARVAAAIKILQKQTAYWNARANTHDDRKKIKANLTANGKLPMNPERLKFVTEMLDVFGLHYHALVIDPDSEEAFEALIEDEFRLAWYMFFGEEIDAIQDIWQPFECTANPLQLQADSLWARVEHWIAAGCRRLGKPNIEQSANTLPERMNAASQSTGIDEFCRLAAISRGTYFNMQNGVPVKATTVTKVEKYLKSIQSPNPVQNESK